jgi:outer membrane usher protein FimD/PapC
MRKLLLLAFVPVAAFAQSNNYVYDTTTNSTNTNTNVNTSTSTATNNNFNTDVSTSTINQTVNSTSNSTVNSTNLNTNRNFNESSSTATNTNRNFNESSSTSVSTATNVNTNLSTSTSESVNTNVNTNISDSRSVSTNVNTNTSVSESKNLNTNTNVSDSKSTSYSESNANQSVTQKITSPPPSAIAPSMMSYSQDLCTTGVSGAVQTQILGISGGKTIRDKNCEALKLSKTLYDMGMRVAAVSLLCQDERVFDAMKMAGTPCPYQGKIGKEAAAAWEENKPKRSSRR